MSCEERESGSYELPAGEFARFKREIKTQWDQSMEKLFNKTVLAQSAYPKASTNEWEDDPIESAFSEDFEFIQAEELFLKKTKTGNWAKPLKSSLQKAKYNALAKETPDGITRLPCYTGTLSIDSKNRRIGWFVSEMNHSVETARSNPVAAWFFNRFLPSVKWTPKTGGMVRYMNEYMRQDDYCDPDERELYGKCDPRQRMNPRPQPARAHHRVPQSFRF